MYTPKHFEETRPEVMHALIGAHPLATLVTLTADGLAANHIPLQHRAGPTANGTLIGHVARSNPMLENLALDVDVLAIFHGPQAYVSPSWYPTKAEHGKVVPTWNYAVVHAHGRLIVHDDPAWVRAHLTSLTEQMESGFAQPWGLQDAPADFIDKLVGAVVGIEIEVTRLEGKWKASQNQPAPNRQGVIDGLLGRDTPSGCPMAALMKATA
ncbi:FMN-binding negative transcriptional regulator [Pseudoduganella sp. GCM10020061]|uniref:FMN-binding negative transcriptional regulator n=1 Tax=Pseudoduganella sp. GCM10020061 TaxID=3317345 RepID=UPI0036451861